MPTIQELRQQLDAELAGIEFTQHISKAERDAAEENILRYKEEGYPYLHPDTEAQLPERIKQAPNRRAITRIGEEYRKTADQVIKAREAESALKAAETPPSWLDRLTRSRQEILDRHAPLPTSAPSAATPSTSVPRPEAILAPPVARAPVGVAGPPDVTPFSVPAEEALARATPAERPAPRLPTSALHSQVRAPGIIETPETSGQQAAPHPSPPGYRELVEPFVEAGKSTIYRGPTHIFDWLDKQADRLSKATGLSKGSLFKDLANLARQKAEGQPVDPTLATQVLSDLGKFSTGEMPKLLAFTHVLGTIPGFAALGAVEGSEKGAKEAVIHAIKNALFGAELGSLGRLGMAQRVTGGAAAFTAQAAAEGERDPEKLLAAAASGALFTFPGPVQGMTWRQAVSIPKGDLRPPGANVFGRLGLDPDTATLSDVRKAFANQAGAIKEATATATDPARRQALTDQFQGLLKDYQDLQGLLGERRIPRPAGEMRALPSGTPPKALPRPTQYATGDYVTRTPGESPRRIADVQTRDGVEYVQLAGDQSYVPAARVELARRKGTPPPPADLSKTPAATLPEALRITSPQEKGPFLVKASPEERATQIMEAVAQTKPTPFPVERVQPPEAAVFNARQEVKRQVAQRERAVETQRVVERVLAHRPVPMQRELALGRETAVPSYLPLQERVQPVMRPEAVQVPSPAARPPAPEPVAPASESMTATPEEAPLFSKQAQTEEPEQMALPERTADTMSEAIALSSPSGSMSTRAKEAAQQRLSTALFGEGGLPQPTPTQPSEREVLLRKAQELRDLADRGMKPKAYRKEAARLEKQAAEMEGKMPGVPLPVRPPLIEEPKVPYDTSMAPNRGPGSSETAQTPPEPGRGTTHPVDVFKPPSDFSNEDLRGLAIARDRERATSPVYEYLATRAGLDTAEEWLNALEVSKPQPGSIFAIVGTASPTRGILLSATERSEQIAKADYPLADTSLKRTGLDAISKARTRDELQRERAYQDDPPEWLEWIRRQEIPAPERFRLPSPSSSQAREPVQPYGLPTPRYAVQPVPPEGVFAERYQVMDRLEGRPASRFPSTSREVAEDLADHLNAGGALMEEKAPYATTVPTFYSQVERVLDQKMPDRASMEQVRGILSPANGVKPDELKWTGLDDYLKTKAYFTKAEVLDYLKANQVEIREVMKPPQGGALTDFEESDYAGLFDRQEGGGTLTPDENRRLLDYQDRLRRLNQATPEEERQQQPKFSSYQLPGGSNYRELLLTLPSRDYVIANPGGIPGRSRVFQSHAEAQAELDRLYHGRGRVVSATPQESKLPGLLGGKSSVFFSSSHFPDTPNVLAHVRMNDRTRPHGEKVLFLEEVQSDWHQRGRKEGYRGQPLTTDEKDRYNVLLIKNSKAFSDITESEKTELAALDNVRTAAERPTPDAPFKKTWPELVMRRMLRYAAEHGYDTLAWTTGAQQADRYDLSKQIDSLQWDRAGKDTVRVVAVKEGKDVLNETVPVKELDQWVGKEIADKIVTSLNKGTTAGEYEGLDLKVGGEGMKGFYDQILPAYLNKYAKKWGAQVGQTEIATAEARTRQLTVYQRRDGVWRLQDATGQPFGDMAFETKEAAEAAKRQLESGFQAVHALPITEAMKRSVLTEGQALFERKGAYATRIPISLSAEPVTPSPVKEGFVRLYHATDTLSAESLARTGFRGDVAYFTDAPTDWTKGSVVYIDVPKVLAEKASTYPDADIDRDYFGATPYRFSGKDVRQFIPKILPPESPKIRITEEGPIKSVQPGERKGSYATRPNYKTRPTAARQLSLDFADRALADLDAASRTVSTLRGALDRADRGREKPRVLAQDFRPELIKTGRIDLRGQAVTSSRDLAMVAQVFRDPRFETLRIIYTKDDKIVAHEGTTLRLPGSTVAWMEVKPLDTVAQQTYGKPFAELSPDESADVITKQRAPAIEKMQRRMARLGADGYWLLHNHPSGEPTPSAQDLAVTRAYEAAVPGFQGHVVINSGRYGVIEPGAAQTRVEPLPAGLPDRLLTPTATMPVAGTAVSGPLDLVELGKHLQQSDRYVTVLYRGGAGKVRAIQEVPVSLFTSPQAGGYLRNQARQFGGVQILTAYQGASAAPVTQAAQRLLEQGVLLDHARLDVPSGQTLRSTATAESADLGLQAGALRGQRVQEPSQRYDLKAIQAEADRTREKNSILLSDIAAENKQQREARRQANRTPLFQGFDVPAETTLDLLRQKLQDKMHRLKVIQDVVTKDTGPITDQADAYLQEELFHGRTEHALNRLEREHVTPLLRSLKEAGVSLEQLDAYLYAKHAPERNAAIDAINPKFREAHLAGSGLTNEQAAAMLRRFEDQGLTEKLIPLAERVYAINRARLRLLDQSGLETPEALAAYAQKYQYYVPLRGEGETPPEAMRPRTGKGFDIRGKESKRALGRQSLALSPTAQTVMQMEESLIRAEKNRVGQAFLKFVEDHPDPTLWEVNKVATKPRFDERTGEVRSGPDPFHRLADNVLSVKRNGQEYYITLHDQALARSMKNLGAEHTGQVVRILGAVNRYFAMLATSLNPEFLISNPIRDIQTAGVNMTEQHSLKFSTDVVRDVPQAILGAWRASRGQAAGDWTAMAERFAAAGGKTGYFATKDLARTQADLAAKLKQADGGAASVARTVIRAMGDLIADANNALENGTRLSVFRHALDDLGLSDERAASLAKNVTVNFNRRGELGTLINSLYLFYNASLQGSVRLLQALRSPLVQKIVAGITVGSFALTELNRLIGGQDPEDGLPYYDKIDDWIKEHNLILMRPESGGRYLKIPLPYGYNVFHILGASLSDVAHGAPPLDKAKQLVLAILNSFNPIGSDAGVIQALSPTITDPIVEIGLNQNFYGAPIKPEQPDYGVEKPESQLFWNSVSPLSKKMAQALNRLTGGSETVPGRLDISPEILDYVVGTLTGGTGQFLNRTANLAERLLTGESVPVRSVPFARRLLGEQSEYDTGRRYRTQVQAVQQVTAGYELLVAQGKRAEAAAYRQSHAKELALTTLARQTQKEIAPWQHQLTLVRAKEEGAATTTPQVERITKMIEGYRKRFNRAYREIMDGQRMPPPAWVREAEAHAREKADRDRADVRQTTPRRAHPLRPSVGVPLP